MKKLIFFFITILFLSNLSFAQWISDYRDLVSAQEKSVIDQKISSKFSQLETQKWKSYLDFEVNYLISRIDIVLAKYNWKILSASTQKNIWMILLIQDTLKKIVTPTVQEPVKEITKESSNQYSKSTQSKQTPEPKTTSSKKDIEYLKTKVYKYVQPDKDGQFTDNWKSYIITSYSCTVLPNKNDLSYYDNWKLNKYLLVLDISKWKSQYLLCQKFEIKESSIWTSLTDIRTQMLNQLNDIRAKNWLKPLKLNDKLNKAAQYHAQDMNKNDYFSHNSQNWNSPSDRCHNFGYDSCWENIAVGASNVDEVMEWWMNSKWHRENILTSWYKEIWIWFDNYYWVQDFGYWE